MSDITQFMATRVPNALFGADTVPIIAQDAPFLPTSPISRNSANLRAISAGSMTANTYKTVLSVTGSGLVNFAAMLVRTGTFAAAMRVTVDGVQVVERIYSTSTDYSGRGVIAIGGVLPDTTSGANWGGTTFDPTPFNQSLLIELRASTSTTNVDLLVNYKTFP